MKKLVSCILSAAIIMSCCVFSVHAQISSAVYAIDADAKIVSGVAPFTPVPEFLAGFENAENLRVVNIDGTEMKTGYATENVFLKSADGSMYSIRVNYAYNPIHNSGAALSDTTELYNLSADMLTTSLRPVSEGGFFGVQAYGKIAYGQNPPSNTASQTVRAVKTTENGQPVYVIENDSNNYAYMRSHYSQSLNYTTELVSKLGGRYVATPIITTVSFEADKLGNIALFNNSPKSDGTDTKAFGDFGMDSFVYSEEIPYIPNSIQFTEDGKIMVGGSYGDWETNKKAPANDTGRTWEPGRKYTVSVVEKLARNGREGYVYGIYVNGEKVFPSALSLGHAGGRLAYDAQNDYYKMNNRDASHLYGGGVSSIMFGTAPKTPGENMTVKLSDVKVYTAAAFNPQMDGDITLSADEGFRVDNDGAGIVCCAASVSQLEAALRGASVNVYNADGTEAAANTPVTSDMYVKAVSADGLSAKSYSISIPQIVKSFHATADGPEITQMSQADTAVWFKAVLPSGFAAPDTKPAVVLAVYEKTGKLKACASVKGEAKGNEVTIFKAGIDLASLGLASADVTAKAFIFERLDTITPICAYSELK